MGYGVVYSVLKGGGDNGPQNVVYTVTSRSMWVVHQALAGLHTGTSQACSALNSNFCLSDLIKISFMNIIYFCIYGKLNEGVASCK